MNELPLDFSKPSMPPLLEGCAEVGKGSALGKGAGREYLLTFNVPRTRGKEGSGRECARQRFYAALVEELKAKYKIVVRKWRTQMTGMAYELHYHDGRIKRMIVAPRPRSPVSAAIFLHEVGHHAIGFGRYRPRCLEEYYVWQWAFREMRAREIPVEARVLRHYKHSMMHYVHLAKKQGLRELPGELHPFLHGTRS